MSNSVRLCEAWLALLGDLFEQPFMRSLKNFLLAEKASGKRVFPPAKQMFRAFDATRPEQVKVVIIGQDPYHGPGQANGLCFSVNQGVPLPPSLENIYRELRDDLGIDRGGNGDLGGWAAQGVLLLNAMLSVRAHQAASHQGQGWEQFTDQVLQRLCSQQERLAIIAWGAFAAKKIDSLPLTGKLVLRSAHPSPLSAHRGFFGSRPFSRVNTYLEQQGLTPIDWSR